MGIFSIYFVLWTVCQIIARERSECELKRCKEFEWSVTLKFLKDKVTSTYFIYRFQKRSHCEIHYYGPKKRCRFAGGRRRKGNKRVFNICHQVCCIASISFSRFFIQGDTFMSRVGSKNEVRCKVYLRGI